MTIRHVDGTTNRASFYGSTKQECKRQAAAAQKYAARVAKAGEYTLGEWLAEWLSSKRRNGEIRPRTADLYAQHIEAYLVPRLGRMQLAELRSFHVQRCLDRIVDDGVGVPTVKAVWATLRSALTRAKQLRLVSENEAGGDYIRLPAHTAKPAKHLEPTDLARFREILLAEAMSGRSDTDCGIAAALLLSLSVGLRNAEVRALTWDDIRLGASDESGMVHVRRTLQRVRDLSAAPRIHTNDVLIRPKEWVSGPPKSEAGNRVLPLFPEVATVLRAHRDRQRLKKFPLPGEGDLVFRSRYGKPLTDVALANGMKKICQQASVDYRSFYALRHTTASAAIAAGESDVSVAQLLGHEDSSTTKRIYARTFEERSGPRMEKMRAFLMGTDSRLGSNPHETSTEDVPDESDDLL